MEPLSSRFFSHHVFEVFMGISDHHVGSGSSRGLRFLVGRDGAEDEGSAALGHLDQEEADATRRRVHQDVLSSFEREGVVGQVVRRHALEKCRRRLGEAHFFRQRHETLGRNRGELRVSSRHHDVADTSADLGLRNTLPDRLDDAGRFYARRKRAGERVEPSSVVDIDEIHANGLQAHEGFARSGFRGGAILQIERLGAARGLNAYRLHGAEYSSQRYINLIVSLRIC